jgi:hypothetical protein
MIGILLLALVAGWLYLAIWVSGKLTRKVPSPSWRSSLRVLFTALIFVLPMTDEIVGGYQFKELCRQNAGIHVNLKTAAGRTVYLARTPQTDVEGTWLRVVLRPQRFVDATTGETVVSYTETFADGGWLGRRLSEGRVPLTFHGSCAPRDAPGSIDSFAALGIRYIEPPSQRGRHTP